MMNQVFFIQHHNQRPQKTQHFSPSFHPNDQQYFVQAQQNRKQKSHTSGNNSFTVQQPIVQSTVAMQTHTSHQEETSTLNPLYRLSIEEKQLFDLLFEGHKLEDAIKRLQLSPVVGIARAVSMLNVLGGQMLKIDSRERSHLNQALFKGERGQKLSENQMEMLERRIKDLIRKIENKKYYTQHNNNTPDFDMLFEGHKLETVPNTISKKVAVDYSLNRLLGLLKQSSQFGMFSTEDQHILVHWFMTDTAGDVTTNGDFTVLQADKTLKRITRMLKVNQTQLRQKLSIEFNWPIYPVPHIMQVKATDVTSVHTALATDVSIINALSGRRQLEALAYTVAGYSNTQAGELMGIKKDRVTEQLTSLSKQLDHIFSAKELVPHLRNKLGLPRFNVPRYTPENVANTFRILSENNELAIATAKQLLAISYRSHGYTIRETADAMQVNDDSTIKKSVNRLAKSLELNSANDLYKYIDIVLQQPRLRPPQNMPEVVASTFTVLANHDWMKKNYQSHRGIELLSYWMQGFSSQLIGQYMDIDSESIATHINYIAKKLNFENAYSLRKFLSLKMELPLYSIPYGLPPKVDRAYQNLVTDSVLHDIDNMRSDAAGSLWLLSVAYLMAGYFLPAIALDLDAELKNVKRALHNLAAKLKIDYNTFIQSPHRFLLKK